MRRSRCVRIALAGLAVAGMTFMIGCLGKRSYLQNRPVPPSTILQRVLVTVQNPSVISTSGILQIVDARYDIRNSENGKIPIFLVGAYSGSLPTTIMNYPEQRVGYVYNSGSGSVTPVNYNTEDASGPISGLGGFANSVYITPDGEYAFAANQAAQVVTVSDHRIGALVRLNLPNVYKVAVNPSGTVALAFVQNSDYAYRIIRLQQPNGAPMAPPVFHPTNGPWPSAVSPMDCQPVNIPTYCVVPVLDRGDNPIRFDRPYNMIFSSDGTTAWLLNCGPECGEDSVDPVTGQATASVSVLNLGPLNVNNFPGSTYPSPPPASPPPTEQRRMPIPGGATMAIYGNGNLYVSGQQRQSDGLFEGFLSVLNLGSGQVTATYPISDGTHTKMLFGDDNTLWIGSQLCQTGERTALNLVNGCLTMFNMNDNTVLVEPWLGDVTGLCAIVQWHKMYTATGGQIHIYATTDKGITTNKGTMGTGYSAGSELDNSLVTVHGTAVDVAYMDAVNNAQD